MAMRFEEYRKHDAISLAGLIAKRQVSAEEVLETAIARAEQVNTAINAIAHKQYEQARKGVAAELPEGPLKGVPYLIKDLAFFETGEPVTFGSSLFKDFVADHETAYVTRCKKAGLVFMGRSSSPEFGLNPNTEPRLYGSCHNPWNLEYSPGGSSGGAAATLSAGIMPMAHAKDGGGSIRIPATQCGLFGLKPTRGRVPMAPDAGEGWGGLSAGHVVSRSVRDSALMLDCTAGMELGDPYTSPMHEGSFVEAVARPPRKLRIALMLKDHRGVKLHPECLEAVHRAAKLCASLGHIVEEADPDLDMVALRPMNARISAANTARSCYMRWKALGREPNADDVEAATWAVYQRNGRGNPPKSLLDGAATLSGAAVRSRRDRADCRKWQPIVFPYIPSFGRSAGVPLCVPAGRSVTSGHLGMGTTPN
jgi:Asp-tRNA(Asn)/Glu-tRNA(Gln) amidotransferase A subunit family amidase